MLTISPAVESNYTNDLFFPICPTASTKYQLTLTPPDFSAFKVKDPFHALGPISVFSARNQWTSMRKAHMKREKNETFGFSVKGDSPTVVAGVEPCSLAEVSIG